MRLAGLWCPKSTVTIRHIAICELLALVDQWICFI